MMGDHDPSNAELMAVLRDQVKSLAHLDGRITSLANETLEIKQRISKNEKHIERAHDAARKAMDSSTDLESLVVRELSGLQANDKKQNADLGVLLSESLERKTQLRTVILVGKSLAFVAAASVPAATFVAWLLTHYVK